MNKNLQALIIYHLLMAKHRQRSLRHQLHQGKLAAFPIDYIGIDIDNALKYFNRVWKDHDLEDDDKIDAILEDLYQSYNLDRTT